MCRPRPRVGCAGVRGEEKDFRGGGCHEKRLTVGRMLVIGVGIWGGLGTYFPRKVQECDLHFDHVCFATDIEEDRHVLKVRRICQIAS